MDVNVNPHTLCIFLHALKHITDIAIEIELNLFEEWIIDNKIKERLSTRIKNLELFGFEHVFALPISKS